MTPEPTLTLCFLLNGDDVLMMHRRFPPNQGLWNGVGGHVEPGESARQAIIREVAEETGYEISEPRFAGLLTWDGFEIHEGGLTIFTAEVPHREFVTNHEGELAWVSRDWACSAPEVVDNIHVFLPHVLEGEDPQHFHFVYREGVRVSDEIGPLPADCDPDRSFQPDLSFEEEQRGDFLLSFDKDRLQIERIEYFIAELSYWAQGRPREVIETSIRHSDCLGIYRQGEQVAFARLVTDYATFAWLCDVFVDPDWRGHGLGKWLVETVTRHADRLGIHRSLLATRDAQGLYQDYGHFHLVDADKYMTRERPDSD
jgi:8-oxo-dGTP pyrophosphatase MutT (NUDIX family)